MPRPRSLGSEVAVSARCLGAGGGACTLNGARAVPPATRRLPCATFSRGGPGGGAMGSCLIPMFALGNNFGDVKEGRSLRFWTVSQRRGAPCSQSTVAPHSR